MLSMLRFRRRWNYFGEGLWMEGQKIMWGNFGSCIIHVTKYLLTSFKMPFCAVREGARHFSYEYIR